MATLDIPALKNLKLAAGDPRPAQLPPRPPAPGAQPGRRQGGARPGKVEKTLEWTIAAQIPTLPRRRRRDQPRRADRPRRPQAPGRAQAIKAFAERRAGRRAAPPRRRTPTSRAELRTDRRGLLRRRKVEAMRASPTASPRRRATAPAVDDTALGRQCATATARVASARGRRPVRRAQAQRCTRRCSTPRARALRLRPDPVRARAEGAQRPAGGAGPGRHAAHRRRPRRGSRRRSPTTSSATARSSRSCATPTSPRSWSTAPTPSTSSAPGKLHAGRRALHRRGAPAPHHRQDRRPGRPSRRRVQPDGRRPAARRQPRQRGHPAAGDRRLAADDPQVLRRPLHGRGPDRLRHAARRAPPTSSRRACAASSTSWSPAAPAPARRRR